MAQPFDLINDIGLSYDGDLILDESGDVNLISGIEWFKREVNKIIRTRLGEWKSEPTIGLRLDDVIGKTNSRETANELKRNILDALTLDNFQFPGKFDVNILPISSDKISIYITYNLLGETYSITKLIYDLDRGISQPINDELESEIKTQLSKKKEIKNPYLNALKNK